MNINTITNRLTIFLTGIFLFSFIGTFGQTTTLNVAPDGDVINTGWGSAPMFSCLDTPANGAISASKGQQTGQVSLQNPVAKGNYTAVALTLRLKKSGAAAERVTVNIVVKGTPVQSQEIQVDSDNFKEYTLVWDKLIFSQLDMSSLEVFFRSSGNSKLFFDHLDCELTLVPSDPYAMIFPPRLSKLLLM
jgi:hypothetical protein